MADNPTEVLVRKLGKDLSKDLVTWLRGVADTCRLESQNSDDLYTMVRGQGASRRLDRMVRDVETLINAPKADPKAVRGT